MAPGRGRTVRVVVDGSVHVDDVVVAHFRGAAVRVDGVRIGAARHDLAALAHREVAAAEDTKAEALMTVQFNVQCCLPLFRNKDFIRNKFLVINYFKISQEKYYSNFKIYETLVAKYETLFGMR